MPRTCLSFVPRTPALLTCWAILSAACSSDHKTGPGDDSPLDGAADDASQTEQDASAVPDDAGRPPRADGSVPPEEDASTDDAGEPPGLPPWSAGSQPWELVPEDEVLETCRLDPEALKAADAILDTPWAVVRYGKLCHQFRAEGLRASPAWSATKTLGALATGIVAYETRNLTKTDRKTGPLSDTDRVDHWLDSFEYNPNAQIAHVLAMIAHNEDLSYNDELPARHRVMEYDTVGQVQINTLSDIMNVAIAQDPTRLGANLDEFIRRFLFDKLGLANSTWDGNNSFKALGFGWNTDIYDMAKVGQLMLRDGVWKGERIVDKEWVYRMTHPSFEDTNTAYGYLTWLNASSGWTIGMTNLPDVGLGPLQPGPCAPVAVYKQHPHGLSEAPSCLYSAPWSCEQTYDVGVWQAIGLAGQVIQGHRGLDLVVVGKDLTVKETKENNLLANPSGKLWDALRPAVVKGDPKYKGNESAFCAAYGKNNYAPDLVD
jgi:hypothetical protein